MISSENSKINQCVRWRAVPTYLAQRPIVMQWFEDAIFHYRIPLPYGAHIVELGTLFGGSAVFLRELLDRHSRPDVKLTTVDTFQGSAEHRNPDGPHYIQQLDSDLDYLKNQCLSYIETAGYSGRIDVLAMSSLQAATQFADGSVNLVYIDAAHDLESVTADIDAWWPKLDGYGIMMGDDYDIDNEGVVTAVRRRFGEHYQADGGAWRVWKTADVDKAMSKESAQDGQDDQTNA